MSNFSKHKNSRKLQDFPGLFDDPGLMADEIYGNMVKRARKSQLTPSHTMSEAELLSHSRKDIESRKELQYISFGSGSSGNCAYLGIRGEGGILIDAGVDTNTVIKELESNYLQPEKIAGIIITHDHSDHIRFAYSLLRKYKWMKIFCTPRTINGLLRRHSISSRIKDYHVPIFKEFEFRCGPFSITPFEVNHDGSDNVGFSIDVGYGKKFVVATDLGEISDRVNYYANSADYLMIESNYDLQMLNTGTYPEYLKARIRSKRGHLDNMVASAYVASIYNPRLKHVYLCHLSHDNNTPQLALDAMKKALESKNITVGDASGSAEALAADIQIYALPRYVSSPLFIHRLK